MSNKTMDAILRMRLQGLKDEAIADVLGMSKAAVQARVRRYKERIRANKPERGNRGHEDTLCWKCARAVPVRGIACSWAASFTPVEGWTAEPTLLYAGNKGWKYKTPSFCVKQCPLFLEDKE